MSCTNDGTEQGHSPHHGRQAEAGSTMAQQPQQTVYACWFVAVCRS